MTLQRASLGATMALVLLAGCMSSAWTVIPDGDPVRPPPGWLGWCDRNPGDPSC